MEPAILIVDDDERAFALLSHFLKRIGAGEMPKWISDGDVAIEHLQRRLDAHLEPPLLLLLDLHMPRKDGFKVLSWIAQTPGLEDMLTVVVSVSDRPEDMARALELGAFYYFEKYPTEERFATVYHLAKRRHVAHPPTRSTAHSMAGTS